MSDRYCCICGSDRMFLIKQRGPEYYCKDHFHLRNRKLENMEDLEIKDMAEVNLDKEYKVTAEMTIVAADELEALTTAESYISTRCDFQLIKVEKVL